MLISHGEDQRVLPPNLQTVNMFVLQLDQGSIGTTGVAFLEFFFKWMVTETFDKIHRCIRYLNWLLKLCQGVGSAVTRQWQNVCAMAPRAGSGVIGFLYASVALWLCMCIF